MQVLRFVAREVAAVMVKGVQVAVVVGGGNYFRGANAWEGLERATADYIGSVCVHVGPDIQTCVTYGLSHAFMSR